MNYDDAHNFIFNEIGEEGDTLLYYISSDKTSEAIDLIKKITNCNDNDAKAIWVDLKCDYGTETTNPFMQSSSLSRQQITQNNQVAQDWYNKPKCPTCNSTNIKKIRGLERGTSVATLGIFSKKINKSFKCSNCGYTW